MQELSKKIEEVSGICEGSPGGYDVTQKPKGRKCLENHCTEKAESHQSQNGRMSLALGRRKSLAVLSRRLEWAGNKVQCVKKTVARGDSLQYHCGEEQAGQRLGEDEGRSQPPPGEWNTALC